MGKDPAFLFYSSDFLTGTMTMNHEQVGKYVRLLCLQHQKGRLEEKDMLNICSSYDKDVFSKFDKDDNGFFYNKRLENETIKRKKYSESRSKNRLSKKSYDTTYVPHMENENTLVVNNIKDYIKNCLSDELWNQNVVRIQEISASKIPLALEDFVSHLGSMGSNPQSFRDFKQHFNNWLRKTDKTKYTTSNL